MYSNRNAVIPIAVAHSASTNGALMSESQKWYNRKEGEHKEPEADR